MKYSQVIPITDITIKKSRSTAKNMPKTAFLQKDHEVLF